MSDQISTFIARTTVATVHRDRRALNRAALRADTASMRIVALLAVLAIVGWLTMRQTETSAPAGGVSSSSQAQRVVDGARHDLDAAAAKNAAATAARTNVEP